MAKEIERKFLVTDESYAEMACKSEKIAQGYISLHPKRTVRIRIKGDRAFLTVKGLNSGAVRDEWEYPVPESDAREMLAAVTEGTVIEKMRFYVDWKGHRWEIDRFEGTLSGLTIAEVELADADETVELPPFIGEEVTGDPRFYNSSLAALS